MSFPARGNVVLCYYALRPKPLFRKGVRSIAAGKDECHVVEVFLRKSFDILAHPGDTHLSRRHRRCRRRCRLQGRPVRKERGSRSVGAQGDERVLRPYKNRGGGECARSDKVDRRSHFVSLSPVVPGSADESQTAVDEWPVDRWRLFQGCGRGPWRS